MDYQKLGKEILFQGMTESEIDKCLAALNSTIKNYKKGDLILKAGKPTDCMGMVLSGSLTIESNDIWGNCTLLSHIGPGQFFAETYALLPAKVMLVDVKANTDCKILFVRTAHVLDSLCPATWKEKLLKNLLRISAGKNLALSERSFHTSPKSCRGRILAYLNTVSLQMRATEFDIPFNRQQLADYLNLERTNMSKELTKMQHDGIIECKKNHFKLIFHPMEPFFDVPSAKRPRS